MNSLRFVSIGILLLGGTILLYAGHTNSGHMGNPSNGHSEMASNHSSNSETHNGQSGSPQSQGHTPQQLLNQNSRLSSNLQKLLPAGTNPQQACSGFKNLGQCVAAIHVSHNLGIPFADLKNKMTGPTSESLGQAIQDLKPDANSKTETKKATKEANDDIKESES